MCKAGVQHLWWAVHVIDLITVIALTTLLIADTKEKAETPQPRKRKAAISVGTRASIQTRATGCSQEGEQGISEPGKGEARCQRKAGNLS